MWLIDFEKLIKAALGSEKLTGWLIKSKKLTKVANGSHKVN